MDQFSSPVRGIWDDIRVLEVSDEKCQLAGKLLGDLGADVIAIEPPEGSPVRRVGPFVDDQPHPDRSLYWWQYNTSKRSITLNLEAPEGPALFNRLVSTADVLFESAPVGALERLGVGYDSLSALNPGLIMVSITPFGQTGPWRDHKTSELVSMGLGGPQASCGYDRSTAPIRPGDYQAWHTSCHYAMLGALGALYHRDLTGEGQYIDCAIHDSLSCTTEGAMVNYLFGRQVIMRGRRGEYHGNRPTPSLLYECKDGKHVALLTGLGMGVALYVHPDAMWHGIVNMLDEAGMAKELKDERYKEPVNRDWDAFMVAELVKEFCQRHTSFDVYHAAQRHGLICGRIYAPDELLDDPHFQARQWFQEVPHPALGRTVVYPGPPARYQHHPWKIHRHPPSVGEHNIEVYCGELGYARDELTHMREAGII